MMNPNVGLGTKAIHAGNVKDAQYGALTTPIYQTSTFVFDSCEQGGFNRYLKKATLKYPGAYLDEKLTDPERRIDVNAVEQLSECNWIDEGKNPTVTGMTGTGKTYLVCALAVCAIRKFYSVRYIKASTLINEAAAATAAGTIIDYENLMIGYDLLIIDDFGFMSINTDDCLRLFEILDGRVARKSTLVSSQLPRDSWYDIFEDNTYADACMDRLIKGSYRLELSGPSLK